MIILIGNEKGGVGKSTLAMNLAVILANNGKTVTLVDTDKQGSITRFCYRRSNQTDLPQIPLSQVTKQVHKELRALDKEFEFVIVDVAGRDSTQLREAMGVAHVMLAPFRASQVDIDTLPTLVSLIQKNHSHNPKLAVKTVITMADTNHMVKEADHARDILKRCEAFQTLKTLVYQRKVYRDCVSDGRGVYETRNMKAAMEMELLLDEVLQ